MKKMNIQILIKFKIKKIQVCIHEIKIVKNINLFAVKKNVERKYTINVY